MSGNLSVLGDLIGLSRREIPTDPTGVKIKLSLLGHAARLKLKHFHLNVTAVGADLFRNLDFETVDYCVLRTRDIYGQVGLTVGRVLHFGVEAFEANGLEAPTVESQLEDITDQFNIDNDGVDMFVPFAMNVASGGGTLLGKSPVPGPCEGRTRKGLNGTVTGLEGKDGMARTFSHELGHYLGLTHRNRDPTNLMAQTKFVQAAGLSVRDTVQLRDRQGRDAKGHCLVNPGC